jgi:hypothetical protein
MPVCQKCGFNGSFTASNTCPRCGQAGGLPPGAVDAPAPAIAVKPAAAAVPAALTESMNDFPAASAVVFDDIPHVAAAARTRASEVDRGPDLQLVEGKRDPRLDKTVQDLILQTSQVAVYVDDAQSVNWYGNVQLTPDMTQVLTDVAHLETVSSCLEKTPHLRPVRRLLAEALARMFGNADIEGAKLALGKAEQYLVARLTEQGRIWYLEAAATSAVIVFLVAALIVSLIVFPFAPYVDIAFSFIVWAAAMGALGALLSILLRAMRMDFNAGAGRSIHRVEGVARICAGALGGLLMALAVKSDLLFGVVRQIQDYKYLILLLGMVAGASERLVPSFIQRVETSVAEQPRSGKSGRRA